VRDAIAFGPVSPQLHLSPDYPRPFAPDLEPTRTLLGWGIDDKQGEDCLVLNIWTPGLRDKPGRPVMVRIHGGGFGIGSGAWPQSDGTRMARTEDVVLVTVNHRLGLVGYLYLAELGGERYAESGNVGMLDLVLALNWVRDNIAEFGGDPGNTY
jgi:para-nitrobenzyl esterase